MVGAEGERVAAVGEIPRRPSEGALVETQLRPPLRHAHRVQRRVGEGLGGHEIHRPVVHVDRPVELRDPPLVQRRRAPAEQERLVRLGRRVDEDRPALGEQSRELDAQLLAELVVEVGERLVEEHELGALDEGPGDGGALLLTAREVQRRALEVGLELQELGRLAHLPIERRLVRPVQTHRGGDVLVDGERGVVDELLVDHRDVALPDRDAGHVAPVHADRARGRAIEPGHQPHQRGLAGEGRAEQHVQRAALEGERDVRDVHRRADLLADVLELEHGAGEGFDVKARRESFRRETGPVPRRP